MPLENFPGRALDLRRGTGAVRGCADRHLSSFGLSNELKQRGRYDQARISVDRPERRD